MLSVAERQAALAARFPAWIPRTLHALFDHVADAYPDRPFLITDTRIWRYADMRDWSRRLAAGLSALGIRRGEHVAVNFANYPEFVALKYAISRIGALAVPINMLNRRDEFGYVLGQSDAVALVTMDRFRGLDYLAALDELAPGWEVSAGGSAFPALRHVVVFATGESEARSGATPFARLELDGPNEREDGDPSAVCDIIYTSGTTGPPKGVLLTHDMLLRAAYGSAYARAFEDGRRILFSLPMYHVYGYVEGLLAAPFVGGAIIPQLRFDGAATLEAAELHRASDALLVPAMTLATIAAAARRDYDLGAWQAVLSSGGRAPERVWRQIVEVLGVREITTGYGMTECTASTTVTRPDDRFERLLETNGRLRDVGVAADPALGDKLVDYRVVDGDTGSAVGVGELGELRARGIGVTAGYYNKPEATAAAFDEDGWLRTGDLGRIDADGYVTLVGRLKESYRCGGEQVLPTEIEDLLTAHPEVLQAHIVPVADERMGEVGIGFVVLIEGAVTTPAELIDLVAARLARFKVPRRIFVVAAEAIPTTASGRARKFLLSQKAEQMLASA